MAFFDKLKNQAASALKKTAANIGCKTENIVFADLPESMEAFMALPQAALSTPFDTAALTVFAIRIMCRAHILWVRLRTTTICQAHLTL